MTDNASEQTDTPATVYLLVQTDEEDGSEASAWILGTEPTLIDGKHAAAAVVEALEAGGWSLVQLEDSEPWRHDVSRIAATGEPRP